MTGMAVETSEYRKRLLAQGCDEGLADAVLALVGEARDDAVAEAIVRTGEQARKTEGQFSSGLSTVRQTASDAAVTLDRRLTRISEKIGRLDGRIDGLDARIDGFKAPANVWVGMLKDSIRAFRGEVSALKARVDGLRRELVVLHRRGDGIELETAGISRRVDELKREIAKINGRIDGFEPRIDRDRRVIERDRTWFRRWFWDIDFWLTALLMVVAWTIFILVLMGISSNNGLSW